MGVKLNFTPTVRTLFFGSVNMREVHTLCLLWRTDNYVSYYIKHSEITCIIKYIFLSLDAQIQYLNRGHGHLVAGILKTQQELIKTDDFRLNTTFADVRIIYFSISLELLWYSRKQFLIYFLILNVFLIFNLKPSWICENYNQQEYIVQDKSHFICWQILNPTKCKLKLRYIE